MWATKPTLGYQSRQIRLPFNDMIVKPYVNVTVSLIQVQFYSLHSVAAEMLLWANEMLSDVDILICKSNRTY